MDRVTQYALDVVNGRVLAGELLTTVGCNRHLVDLNRQGDEDFPYIFNEEALNGLLVFASVVPEPKTGKPQPLMDWEVFILGSLVAWQRTGTPGFRFRRAIVSVARTNGKTYIAAILAAYVFFVVFFGKNNQEILLSSNTTNQTVKLFNYTKGAIEKMKNTVFEEFSGEVTIRDKDILDKSKNNMIGRISAESGKYDSFHATLAIFDEAGDQRKRDAFNSITSGMVSEDFAIFLQISTAYQNPNAPLRDDIKSFSEAIKRYDHSVDDFFLAVWCQDDASEAFEPSTWEKSNPLLGLETEKTKRLNGLISERNTLLKQGKMNDFLVKNMNLWLNADQNAAFNLDDLEKSIIPKFNMLGRAVYIGFDNSMTSDDAALFFNFPYFDDKGNERWYLYQHSFIPWHKAGSIEAKEDQDGINYRHMEELGFASVTRHEKGLIDNDFIFTWLMEFVEKWQLNVIEFDYDAAHSYAIIKAIEEATTWNMVGVRQGTISLNEPTKWIQEAFIEGRLTRSDDPMMQKSFINAVIVSDNNGIKIDKNRATYKIDLVDACVDSFYNSIYHFEDFADNSQVNDYSRMTNKQIGEYIMSGDFGF